MSFDFSDEMLKLDNQFCFVVYALSRKITALYRPLLDGLGLTYPQYLVMLVLWQAEQSKGNEKGVPIKFICEKLMLETGTLTPLLKRLESNGLIQRQRAQNDERSMLISLSPEGLQLKDRAREVPGKLLCQMDYPLQNLVALKQQLQGLLG